MLWLGRTCHMLLHPSFQFSSILTFFAHFPFYMACKLFPFLFWVNDYLKWKSVHSKPSYGPMVCHLLYLDPVEVICFSMIHSRWCCVQCTPKFTVKTQLKVNKEKSGKVCILSDTYLLFTCHFT